MADIATISALILAIKHATEVAKTVRELDLSLEKAELKQKMVDLMETLSDVRIQAIDIQEELLEKNKKIAELQEMLRTKGLMGFKEPVYYMEGDNTPFCPRCWEADQCLIHLTKTHTDSPADGWHHCNNCKRTYNINRSRRVDRQHFDHNSYE